MQEGEGAQGSQPTRSQHQQQMQQLQTRELICLVLLPLLLLAMRFTVALGAASSGRNQQQQQQNQCPTPEGALLRQMLLDGGISPAQFPFRIARPAACGPPGPRWLARVRTTLVAAPGNLTLRRSGYALAVDTDDGISVLSPDDQELPTIRHSRSGGGSFAISRSRLLGLVQCERLPEATATIAVDAAASGDGHLLGNSSWRLEPEQYTVLHHGYSRSWQLWLRRPAAAAAGTSTAALAVRVLHEASGACAVQRAWTLAPPQPQPPQSGAASPPVVESSEYRYEFLPARQASGSSSFGGFAGSFGNNKHADGIFRLPTACYRVEL